MTSPDDAHGHEGSTGEARSGEEAVEDTVRRSGARAPDASGLEDTARRAPAAGGDAPAEGAGTSFSEALQRGAQVGRYVVLKSVGQGGMGMVYAAYDPELDRKVALKLLRPDHRGVNPVEARTRQLREAQVMARVSHPNVCSVFDVGTFEDQIFLAMEFIEGPTLQQWLQSPRAWREVLGMLLQAGQGLVAAHEAGLVHRDFKPANVLVGKNDRPYVTDFGLARMTPTPGVGRPARVPAEEPVVLNRSVAELALTQVGAMVGTPLYMPPEQYLGLPPDARSDQFSFCVVLFQGLYGLQPFESQEMYRAVAAVARTGPVPQDGRFVLENVLRSPPSDSKVPAWVRRAVVRGLSLSPADRFPSLKDLLDELSQEPRRARRRWMAVAGGVTLAGLAAVGALVQRQSRVCAGADGLMAEVWNPGVQRAIEATFIATGRPFAADAARSVSRSLGEYASAWVGQQTEACLDTRVRAVQTEELLSKRVVCLERRRKDLRALTQVFRGADAQVVERAVNAVGALPALQECRDVEALANQVSLPADPTLRAEIERLGTKLAEVKAQTDAGKYQLALDLATQLEPQVMATGYRPLMGELHYRLGWLRFLLGEGDSSPKMLEQAFKDMEAGRADRQKVGYATKLAYLFGHQQQWEKADHWGGLARATLERIGNDELLTADLMGNLGAVEVLRERFSEARAYLEKTRELQEKLLPAGHPSRVTVMRMLASVMALSGEGPRAAELSRASLQQAKQTWGPVHPEMARGHLVLGQVLHDEGDYTDALEHAEAALRISRDSLGAQHPYVTEALNDVGRYQLALKRYAQAQETFEAQLELQLRILSPDDPSLQLSYDGIGQALLGLGKASEAVRHLEKGLSFNDAPSEALAESHFGLARALWAVGQPKRALVEANRARERFLQLALPKRTSEVESWLKSRPTQP
jgi:eukaryotic-like serine/threonine-protein kinase